LHRFNCGNLESLKQDGIRESLLAFHKKWYSANIMELVVTGKHTLEYLEKWVTEMFSAVENKDVVEPNLGEPKHPFTHDNLSTLIRFKPIKDSDTIEI
jgi:insulysin